MNKLDEYREELTNIDKQIATLLLKRISIIKKIGVYKKEQNLSIFQEQREKFVLNYVKSFSSMQEEQNFLEIIFQKIMDESKEVQK